MHRCFPHLGPEVTPTAGRFQLHLGEAYSDQGWVGVWGDGRNDRFVPWSLQVPVLQDTAFPAAVSVGSAFQHFFPSIPII